MEQDRRACLLRPNQLSKENSTGNPLRRISSKLSSFWAEGRFYRNLLFQDLIPKCQECKRPKIITQRWNLHAPYTQSNQISPFTTMQGRYSSGFPLPCRYLTWAWAGGMLPSTAIHKRRYMTANCLYSHAAKAETTSILSLQLRYVIYCFRIIFALFEEPFSPWALWPNQQPRLAR